jgi:P-type Ca2+ transporter type 2C
MSLFPSDAQEQWKLVQSFDLVPQAEDLKAVVDMGVSYKQWQQDVDRYLKIYGPNELPKPVLPSYFSLWIGAFYDIMMILLLIAMIVLFSVGDVVAATAILVILLIATNIGAYTEYTSNLAAAELGDLPGTSLVRSHDHPEAISGWVRIPNTNLLPGMLVQLKTGDNVPADSIILTYDAEVYCTEALLTGESEPVHKFPFCHLDELEDEDDEHERDAKKLSMTRLYMGTEFAGDCVALVVETGEKTQMGRIFQSMADADPERSPLQKMIDRLIFVLAMLSIAASTLNAAVCIPTGRGVEPNPTDPQALVCVLNSIALTVAAVPENLPVALVIALAAIIKNLARRGVIVKSLPAGEELSRLNYVFSDKTGTLTKNEMTARAVVTVEGYVALKISDDNKSNGDDNNRSGDEFVPPAGTTIATAGGRLSDYIRIVAAEAQDTVRSNPTGDACIKAYPSVDDLAVERVHLEAASSKTKMARAALTLGGKKYLAKVGSDWVLSGATKQATLATDLVNLQEDTLQEFDRQQCMDIIETWANQGYRVICVVAKPVEELPDEIVDSEVGEFGDGFIFLGCLAIQDPPREDVAHNIEIIRGAGVVVSMITGDNPVTGMSIAKQIGLADNYTDEDNEMCLINAFTLFQNMEEDEAKKIIYDRLHYSMTHKKALIIGRVSPFQKRMFVEVARSMGLVVAMTGDGANDGPALKGANVGIAIGNGSDIAKAAGDMILVNPSFGGIVEAIRAGRLGFDNILKFLMFLLGTNISEVTIYLSLTFADVVIVLDALNLLVLNLLTDGFPAIALSLEEAEGDLMKRDPLKKSTSVLNKFTYMSIIITNGALLSAYVVVILLGNMWYLGSFTGNDPTLVDDYETGLQQTRMMFILLINISELLLGFTHRCPDRSVFSVGLFSSKSMNYASLSSVGIIILFTHVPGLKDVMKTHYLDWEAYLLVVGMSFWPCIVHEIAKVLFFERLGFNVYSLYKYEYDPKASLQGPNE